MTLRIALALKAARKYNVSIEKLIAVVLIHELAHLITHQDLHLEKTKEEESDLLWEYIAQCATYAYLKKHLEQ